MLDHWDTDPFVPTRKDGKIYARGTQDMKVRVCLSVCVYTLKRVGGWAGTHAAWSPLTE